MISSMTQQISRPPSLPQFTFHDDHRDAQSRSPFKEGCGVPAAHSAPSAPMSAAKSHHQRTRPSQDGPSSGD